MKKSVISQKCWGAKTLRYGLRLCVAAFLAAFALLRARKPDLRALIVTPGQTAALMFPLLLYLGIRWAGRGSNLLASLLDMRLVWLVLLGPVLLGVVICVVSTLLVVRRVAYVSKDDLYY